MIFWSKLAVQNNTGSPALSYTPRFRTFLACVVFASIGARLKGLVLVIKFF
jgi:hypothetical protein